MIACYGGERIGGKAIGGAWAARLSKRVVQAVNVQPPVALSTVGSTPTVAYRRHEIETEFVEME